MQFTTNQPALFLFGRLALVAVALILIALIIIIVILVVLLPMITAIMRDLNSHGAKRSISRDIGSLDCDGVYPPIAATVSFRADLQ